MTGIEYHFKLMMVQYDLVRLRIIHYCWMVNGGATNEVTYNFARIPQVSHNS